MIMNLVLSNIKTIIITSVLLGFAAALWHVTGLRADLITEKTNNKVLQEKITEQQRVVIQIKKDLEDIKAINISLSNETTRQRVEMQSLIDRFNTTATGQSRDFGLLALRRPTTMQRLVNRGTRNAMRCLELASGAPHTTAELAVSNSSQANPECPRLANPNYWSVVP